MEDTTETSNKVLSPMMQQWAACKKNSPGCILLFRMGDFYEAFHEDAPILSRELDLTLTSRQETPMSGIPVHTSEAYIDKLVARGYRVAVAEQLEEAKNTKGLVKREVVKIVTPGTVIHSQLLSEKANNFFASMIREADRFGLAFLDLTTGELWASEWEEESALFNELHRLNPAECLTSMKFEDQHRACFEEMRLSFSFLLTHEEEWFFDYQRNADFLLEHFQLHQLDGVGLKEMRAATRAAGALLLHLRDRLSLSISHIRELRTYSAQNYMAIDRMTQRNLEICRSLREGERSHTLLSILDETVTPMGGRLIQNWLKRPLLSISAIAERQEAIFAFLTDTYLLHTLRMELEKVRDLERLMGRIQNGYASPRDLTTLNSSFEPINAIKKLLTEFSGLIQQKNTLLDPLPELHALLTKALVEAPPARLGESPTFRPGFHAELDELCNLSSDSKAWVARYQSTIREETGIKSLKVGFNNMFGYYIEVSRGQSEKMGARFTRRQTLVNAERFITPELKEYENKIFSAQERIQAIERALFEELKQTVLGYLSPILQMAHALAELDTLAALAEVARKRNYIRPTVDASLTIEIKEGRHPVIEAACLKERFIANDTFLDDEHQKMLLITGPNMAGKSTYLRQVALIVLMAQIGSFVPAKAARIGIVDKLFTRIGASDDLSRGQSTFMVEMSETAYILHHATPSSLVILDEIGRGTGTNDGISIAWAVAEFLLTQTERSAKTLFATHYWELTKLEEKIPGALNYHMAVHETGDKIHFLRKILKGGTDKSYGVQVARLAGLPLSVIQRAQEIMTHIEATTSKENPFERARVQPKPHKLKPASTAIQLTLWEP